MEASKEKEEAEVALLKAQAVVCAEDAAMKKAESKGMEIANKGAQIANLRSIMDSGELTPEQMAECRIMLYKLGTEIC